MSTAARPLTGEIRDPEQEDLKVSLIQYQGRFAQLLPKHITPERVVILALLAATKAPDIYKCSRESVVLSIMRIASWGLEIGSTAHLVPFFDSKSQKYLCQAIPDYRGVCEMLLRPHHGARHVRDVFARCVFEGEVFRVKLGSEEYIEHEPVFGSPTRKVTHVYAIAKLPHSRFTFEVMSREEVEAIRNRAKAKDGPAWRDHWPEMAKKTALKRISKRLPMYGVPENAALADAIAADDDVTGDSPLAPMREEPAAAAPVAAIAPPSVGTSVAADPPPEKPAEKPAAEKLFPMKGPFKDKPLGALGLDVITGYIEWIRKKQDEKSDETFFADLLAALVEVAAAKKAEAERHQTKLELDEAPAKSHVSTAGYGGDSEQLTPEQLAKAGDVAAQASDPMQAPPARGARAEARASMTPGKVADAITSNPQSAISSSQTESSPPDSAPLARAKQKVRAAENSAKKPHSIDDGRGKLPFDEEESI